MDLRNWNNDEDVKRFKEFFGKGQLRKEESWNMTGTNNFNGSYMKSFFGSHLKSKQIKNLKVVILD